MVEHRQNEVLSIIGVFTVLAFIFVVVRIYSRYLGRNFGWDDYLIAAGMALLLGETIAMWKCKF
jgi:positive regulator of sigma E activity